MTKIAEIITKDSMAEEKVKAARTIIAEALNDYIEMEVRLDSSMRIMEEHRDMIEAILMNFNRARPALEAGGQITIAGHANGRRGYLRIGEVWRRLTTEEGVTKLRAVRNEIGRLTETMKICGACGKVHYGPEDRVWVPRRSLVWKLQ